MHLSLISSHLITHLKCPIQRTLSMIRPKKARANSKTNPISQNLNPPPLPPPTLRSSNLTLLNRPLPLRQPLQRLLPILRQLRPSQRRHAPHKEPRTPLHASLFALPRLASLPLFNLRLEDCGAPELLRGDGFGDAGPVAEGFVGELGRGWGEDLGG